MACRTTWGFTVLDDSNRTNSHARLFIALLLTSLLTACGAGDQTTPDLVNSSQPPTVSAVASPNQVATTLAPENQSLFIQAATKAINEVRAKPQTCGGVLYPAAPQLNWNEAVAKAAQLESEWMQLNNVVSHSWTDGTGPGERLRRANYVWSAYAENIAAGQASMTEVVSGWLASTGHCINLMNANVVDLGLAKVDGNATNQYSSYWTLVVARGR
jgi:uncharacterized protein YkwD